MMMSWDVGVVGGGGGGGVIGALFLRILVKQACFSGGVVGYEMILW